MCKFDNNCLVIWCRYAKFIDRYRTFIYFCTVFEDISDECVIACHFWIHKSLDTINIIACFYIFSVRPFQSITKVECISKSIIWNIPAFSCIWFDFAFHVTCQHRIGADFCCCTWDRVTVLWIHRRKVFTKCVSNSLLSWWSTAVIFLGIFGSRCTTASKHCYCHCCSK